MMDPLSQLISNEVARRLEAGKPRVAYGVWIAERGWLKNHAGRVFASEQVAVAQTAARLWGRAAQVLPVDESLGDLERTFLEQQQVRWTHRLKVQLLNGVSRFSFRKQPHA